MDMSIQRVVDRQGRPSTKLCNNTYGRVTWVDPENPALHEVTVTYYDTDILTVWCRTEPDGDDAELGILAVRIWLNGYDTQTTFRRINAFLCRYEQTRGWSIRHKQGLVVLTSPQGDAQQIVNVYDKEMWVIPA